jgi:hypothetical protein
VPVVLQTVAKAAPPADALTVTMPGDTSTATPTEAEAMVRGTGARLQR